MDTISNLERVGMVHVLTETNSHLDRIRTISMRGARLRADLGIAQGAHPHGEHREIYIYILEKRVKLKTRTLWDDLKKMVKNKKKYTYKKRRKLFHKNRWYKFDTTIKAVFHHGII